MANEKNLDNLRHTCAHLLAAAMLRIYPDTKLTIGPPIENGFYYDFDLGGNKLTDTDLPKIEKMMNKTLKDWDKFTKRTLTKDEALEFYKDNPYKKELIKEISDKGEDLTFYKIGYFEDLCRGGHAENPREQIGAIKLLNLAGAYWRGSEKNKMLTRIYGTCFPTQDELDQYLESLEEAKKRDHKRLGRELDLFMFEKTSPGMAYWLPKGQQLYDLLVAFIDSKYEKFGYQKVSTPLLNKKDLYETSGHWSHYRDDMFISDMTREGESEEIFGVKPMNCPNAMTIFGSTTRSYNDLPLRLAETSLLHRYELSGTLNGLFRIRAFRQDDAHIFVTEDHVASEFKNLMQMTKEIYEPFEIEYSFRFGTRPEKFLGEPSDWDRAEDILRNELNNSKVNFSEVKGEGAFYGPKVDILMKDSLGRSWQTGTIQLDLQQPKRFNLNYINDKGEKIMPFVFHRAILGSFERFIGVFIEHTGGKLPIWLSPIQIVILPISDRHVEHALKVQDYLRERKIRVEVNTDKETLQNKIRKATLQKVPFMGIIGDKESESIEILDDSVLSIRTREGKDLGQLSLFNFVHEIENQIG